MPRKEKKKQKNKEQRNERLDQRKREMSDSKRQRRAREWRGKETTKKIFQKGKNKEIYVFEEILLS